jgi:hypothetical protein
MRWKNFLAHLQFCEVLEDGFGLTVDEDAIA